MSTGRDEALAESAGRIADGRDEGWDEVLADPAVSEGERVALGRVARIARAWRDLGVHAPDEDAAAGPVLFRWGDLEVREQLGEGSFGEVYRAWDPALAREVALKLRRGAGDDEHVRNELAEARRLARVRHPNVLVVYGVDVRDGRAGMWTELVHGETLEALLAARGPFGPSEAGTIGLDLCRALAAVHAAGLAHGDVKPGNVMREAGGRIVLMDFGSGSEAAQGASPEAPGGWRRIRLTGTPLASAPELFAGHPAWERSDIYSLGALLFRLVTGRHLIEAASREELQAKSGRDERLSLRALRPDLPSTFIAAVERAVARNPGFRWRNVGEFEQALLEAVAGTTAQEAPSGPPTTVEPGARPAPWRRHAAIAAAAALVAFLGLGVLPRLAGRVEPPAGGGTVSPPQSPAPAVTSGPVAVVPAPAGAAREPAAAEIEVAASLWRARDGERMRLEDGGAIAAGDHLFLDYLGVEQLFVYVLDEDERGETFTLFPVAGTDLANPLPAGIPLRLPGQRAGEPFDWVVTSAGGREHVLVVASRQRLAVLEDLVAGTTPAESGREVRYAQVPDEAMATLRGIGGMAPAPAGSAAGSRLGTLAAALAARKDPGLWVRHLVLQSR